MPKWTFDPANPRLSSVDVVINTAGNDKIDRGGVVVGDPVCITIDAETVLADDRADPGHAQSRTQ